MKNLASTITINPDGENIVSEEVLRDDSHMLCVGVDCDNKDVCFHFSSRQAMYDFARSLLHEAIFGLGGQKEFYPLIVEDKALIVEGVRLSEDSSRVFVSYADDSA